MNKNSFHELSILVVDDEPDVCLGLKHLIKSLNFEVDTSISAEDALHKCDREKFDIVLSDVNMPGMKGDQLLLEIKKKWPFTEIVLITGYGSIEMAVQCLQAGAAHFITKPFDNDDLKDIIRKLGRKILSERKAILEGKGSSRTISENSQMHEVYELVNQVAPTMVSILIEGKTGTGKEIIARAIYEKSKIKHLEYQAVNCAALPDTLLESELFGHKKGAFTGADSDRTGLFAKAKGGTIFLDEIASMSITFQGKLLRVLQEKVVRPLGSDKDEKVDFRLISATNKDLHILMKNGEFREDLFYRISTMIIRLPLLKDRKEDILALANLFLNECAEDCLEPGAIVPNISTEAADKLIDYNWPGNVRELKNVMQSALIMCRDSSIMLHHLNLHTESLDPFINISNEFDYELGKHKVIESFQRRLVEKALKATRGNVTHASTKCGITRAAFQKIMRALEIDKAMYKD